MTDIRFHLIADISSESPAKMSPVVEGLSGCTVIKTTEGFHLDGWLEGKDARELHRELLSALRRLERRTRLRAEWIGGGMTYRFFDYVLKSSRAE